MHYFEFLNILEPEHNSLSESEAFLCSDITLLSTKPLKIPFQALLTEIASLFSSVPTISCFISYAWANATLSAEEFWVEETVLQLASWLNLAGIVTTMDKADSRFGNPMQNFMETHVRDDSFVILVGSRTLRTKLDSPYPYNVKTEYAHIQQRLATTVTQKQNHSIMPIIFSGKDKEALPDELFGKVAIEDFSGNGLLPGQLNVFLDYFQKLFEILYKIPSCSDDIKAAYKKKWQCFKQEVIFCRGNHSGNLTIVPFTYFQQAKVRQRYFGRQKQHLIYQLPEAPNTCYVGRKATLDTVINKMMQNLAPIKTQITVVSGLGGTGKSTFAQHVMTQLQHTFKTKIWLDVQTNSENIGSLSISPVKTPLTTNLYYPILNSLGFMVGSFSVQERHAFLFEWLRDHPGWLIVLDDASKYEEIKAYIPPHGGHVLITSRMNSWPIQNNLTHHKLKELELDEAKELMDYFKVEYTEAEIADLAILLDSLPLGFVQTAGYLNCNPNENVTSYIALYNTYPVEASTNIPGYAEYKNIWHTVSLSLDKIPPDAILLLQRCALFSNLAVSRVLLAQYADLNPLALNGTLEPLLAYYLITANKNDNTLRIHSIVSMVVFEKMNTTEQVTTIEFALNFIQTNMTTIFNTTENILLLLNWIPKLFQQINKLASAGHFINEIFLAKFIYSIVPLLFDHDNMHALYSLEPEWRRLLDNPNIIQDTDLYYNLLTKFLSFCVKKRDGFEWLQEKYQQFPLVEMPEEKKLQLELSKGVIAIELGNYTKAIEFFMNAINKEELEPYEQARALGNCCTAYVVLKNITAAEAVAKRAISLLSALKTDEKIISLRTYIKANLGEYYIDDGRYDLARTLRMECLQEIDNYRTTPKHRAYAWNYFSLAKIECRCDNIELADSYYERFVQEMSKVFGPLESWPQGYQDTANKLHQEMIVKKTLSCQQKLAPSLINP